MSVDRLMNEHKQPTPGGYSYARDGFIYLLSYATLLISAVSFNNLAKALVGRVIPDISQQYEFFNFNDSALIGYLAALIIALPVFIYLNYYANKMLGQGKMRRDTGVRNWLIYVTLVVVILVIIFQLISLFISYFGGELISRFLINALITVAIAVAILIYQLWHLNFFAKEGAKLDWKFKVFEWKIFLIVLALIVWAFMSIGSPAQQRLTRLDNIRIERLSNIRSAIQDFYGYKDDRGNKRLPNSLEELVGDSNIYLIVEDTVDPVTGELFGYRIVNQVAGTYELSATFDTEMIASDYNDPKSPVRIEGFTKPFYHGIGEEVFELEVEK